MSKTDQSNFKRISLGIVAEDKNDNSKFISVFLKEKFPFHEGDITIASLSTNIKGVDAFGEAYDFNLHKSMCVKAEWLGRGNRITSPSVRKGEEVDVYQTGDTGLYYWEETGRSNHLRRGESITWAFNGSSAENTTDDPPTAENHYTATVDTKNGHVTVSTSTANSEKAGYTFQMNGKDGNATLTDTHGNVIQVDSVSNTITVKNKEGTYIRTHGKNIEAFSSDSITLKSSKVIIDAELTVKGKTTFNKDVNAQTINATTLNAKVANIDDLNA